MAIRIPKATDAGLGREQQRPVNTGQDINAAPLGPNKFSTSSSIAEAGQSVANNLGQVAVKRYEQQLKVADENASMNSYTGFSKEVNELANIGDDAWFIRKGEKSFNTYAEAQQAMDKLAEKYSQNLTNDRQKNQFFRLVADRRASMEESLSRYEASQRSAYNIESEKSFIQTNIQNAVLNYTDPNQIELAKKEITETTLKNREGLPKDALDLRLQSRLSLLQTGIIEKLSTTAPYKAYALFKKEKDSLTPEDRSKAESYLKNGADSAFYTMLEKDPVEAQKMIDAGFFGGVVDAEKRESYRNAITRQVNNIAKRAEVNQYLSTITNEKQLFDSIVGSNRQDGFAKLYEYQKGFNADPVFVEKARNILLKSNGPTPSERTNALASLESSFSQFEYKKKKDGKVDYGSKADLKSVVEFNRQVQLDYLSGNITKTQADSYVKRMNPILADLAKKEKGYDDAGFDGFDDPGEKDYNIGTEAISQFLKNNGRSEDLVSRARMMSRFIELQGLIPKSIKDDPIAYGNKINDITKYVTEENSTNENPIFSIIGVPNSVMDASGKIKNYKEGKSDVKIDSRIKISENIIVKSINDKQVVRMDLKSSTGVVVDKITNKVIGKATLLPNGNLDVQIGGE